MTEDAPMRATFATAVFASAFLLFVVQPMMGRYVLPWYGGTPATWAACMLFYQVLLFAGYAFAHGLANLRRARVQVVVHVGLLIAATLSLPITPDARWKPAAGDDPLVHILGMLLVHVGLPYFLLATTTPLLQRWYAAASGADPYRLYAVSNAGSLLGLLGYPFVVEPWLSVDDQTHVWSWAFGLAAIAVTSAGLLVWRRQVGTVRVHAAATSPAPGVAERWLWLGLAAVPSAMLLAITNLVSTDVAAHPLLWVLPLALYLLTFILSFAGERFHRRGTYLVVWILTTLGLVWTLGKGLHLHVVAQVGVALAALFSCGMLCHGALARRRPGADRLTAYYLWLSAGGAVGGAFVALVAPMVFTTRLELPLVVIGTYVLVHVAMREEDARSWHRRWLRLGSIVAVPVVMLAAWEQLRTTRHGGTVVDRERNFYGTLEVVETSDATVLVHGRTTHGAQLRAPALRREATTYYGPDSGVGRVLRRPAPGGRRVGAIGLGIGTIARYGARGDVYEFYEIDPAVVAFARTHFDCLRESEARVEVTLGDGRIELERAPPRDYDVLVLDAFTSDAVPMHLLTVEAFATYLGHLRAGGIVAAHVSNRHLAVGRVVVGAADHHGLVSRIVESSADPDRGQLGSRWVLMARDEATLAPFVGDAAVALGAPPVRWTDARRSLLEILR